MTYSDVLATLALGISIATAVWTTYRTLRWAKPVVRVSGQQWIGGSSEDPSTLKAGFSIEVINIGNEETQVLSAGWQIDRGPGIDVRFTAGPGGGGIDSLFEHPKRPAQPTFPVTLGRYEHREWEWDMAINVMHDLEESKRARPYVEYTSRKKRQTRYGPWEPTQIAVQADRLRKQNELS